MAGLQFNPYRTLGENPNDVNQSVPTVASDYLTPQQRVASVSPLNIQWDPNKLAEAQQKVQWLVNSTPEEKERVFNPMYSIDRWNKGVAGLDEEERRQWEQENAHKIAGQTDEWIDRLWRNQEFIRAAGMDVFNSIPNYEDRDKMYMDYLTSEAVLKKYEGNENLDQLMNLTPEGKMELLNSGYKSDLVLNTENKELKDRANKESLNLFNPSSWTGEGAQNWKDYTLGERLQAVGSEIGSQAKGGAGVGGAVGASVGTPFFGVGAVVGSIAGTVIGGASGALSGLLTGIEHPELGLDKKAAKNMSNNAEILNKVTVADNERLKEQSFDAISRLNNAYIDAYTNGQLSEADINNEFDSIALNGKRALTDEFGNVNEYDYQGSNYYSAYKDTDEFEHFDVYQKMKYLAQSKVLGERYGMSKALQVLDQDMQNYVSNNQTGWTWAGNSLKNVWVGGVANLGMNLTGLGALNARLWYGEEGLANYLKGMDASGNGEANIAINNPQYWNKVDEMNTFSQSAMETAEKNGGISIYNNVYTPGSEGDFWSWSTLNEAIKMNKFFWSDALKNIGLAKGIGKLTKLAGGIELAPGVLATESTTAAKVINKLGSAGIMANSSVGIDAAYGMQTYNDVLNENNRKLDKIIEEDVQNEVNRRLASPQTLKRFEDAVNAENERRRLRAGERGSYIGVDEHEAWKAYVDQITNEVRQEQEALHAEDRQQAENDAANAYAVDASIEALRMATTNGMFKSYLFDKGTLNALRLNNPYVNTTFKNGAYAVGKHAIRNKALGILGTNIWGGFHSNYYDDITVGYAEGFGIQDYNNYLLQKYNPAAYGSVIDDYISPYVAAMTGAKNAMTEKRSFLDGGVGALGTLFTLAPNVSGMLSHKERMKQFSESIDKAEKGGGKAPGISFTETISSYISSPVLEAVVDAREASRMTQREINRVNDEIKENEFAFNNIVDATSALNERAIAKDGTSIMQAEDAKDKEAFALASSLLSLKNSAVVANAQAEPSKANWSKKKKASAIISRALNTVLGIQMFEGAESPYTRAMLALEDGATIDELPAWIDNITEAEAEENGEKAKAWRQTNLIKTFLGLDANKSATEGMSQEQKVAFAKERIKKNSNGLLDIMEKTEKLQKKFENSFGAQTSPEMAQQLIYQYVLDDRWKQRSKELEQDITGEEISDEAGVWFNRKKQNQNNGHHVIAKYGSLAGQSRALEAQTKRVQEAQEKLDKASEEVKKEADPTKSIRENAALKALRMFKERQAQRNLDKEKKLQENIADDKAVLEQALQSSVPVILAEDILKLSADDRLRMLDDYYRNDYSKEQQEQIDLAKNMLIEDGTPINDAMQKVRDAAILEHRIEDNMEVAKTIMSNPLQAKMMQQALEENRKRAVVDYFNDKIVGEAMLDFMNDATSTISEENVQQKAKNYSTAVLQGIEREASKMLKTARSYDDVPDITLQNLVDGIHNELDNRFKRMKETVELDNYVRKTKKVPHTEVVLQEGAPESAVNPETGQMEIKYAEAVTTERELSDNDRKLIDYALDYAAEKAIPADEMVQKITVDGYDDFMRYVAERNHSGITVEQQAVPVSQEYMNNMLSDIVDAFKKNKEQKAVATADKTTTPSTQSTATAPVDTKGAKPDASNEKRPDDSYNPDPFGVMGKQEGTTETKKEDTEEPVQAEGRNGEILDAATTLNEKLLGNINTLLNEVDKLNTTDEVKDKLKDIISALVSSRSFKNIKELQNYIYGDAATMTKEISDMATVLIGKDIEATKKKAAETTKNEQNLFQSEQAKPFLGLETIDLDEVIDNPRRKSMSDYIKDHRIVQFLQKLYNVWKEDIEGKGKRHQAQVYFIYDPKLAGQIQREIADQTAPVIMALEITDVNRDLVDDDSQLVAIKDISDNKTIRYYQPLGFMPTALDTKENLQGTIERMSAIRGQIKYSQTINGKEVPIEGTRLIRYSPKNNTGKDNGTAIHTNIALLESHTDEESIPHNTETTPKSNVQNLMENNTNTPSEAFVSSTPEERQAYEEAKQKGPAAMRANSLYQRMINAFIDRLSEGKRKSADGRSITDLLFNLRKGSNDKLPKNVFVKAIGETLDKNTGRLIVEILRDINSGSENYQELLSSNSRFQRLFDGLKKVVLPVGLFNTEGKIAVNDYDSKLTSFAKDVERTIDNNLNVDDLSVTADITDEDGKKVVNIHAFSGDEELSTLHTLYNGTLSEGEFAEFVKDLILDKKGNTRQGLKDDRYERVKWQVIYQNAETAKDKTQAKKVRDAARNNLADLYDDGVLEMQVTKLAYKARSVTAAMNRLERSRLWPESVVRPEQKAPEATETKASFEVESPEGKLDGDSGMRTDAPTKQGILTGLPERIMATINKMIIDSKARVLSTENPAHYIIDGQIYSRVTSVKYDMDGMGERFNPENAWALPSTALGTSFDSFGRDVLNGVFDSMTDEQREAAFGSYDNSTAKNYAEAYRALKAFEARLAGQGQAIISIGTKEDPGHITAKGMMNVTVKEEKGITTKQLRTAGTLDILAVDNEGNLHIYDFKTHHAPEFNKTKAVSDGYDRQLSMYAKFLEEEYGLPVKSINIIPIKADYPVPSGKDNKGEAIPNAEMTYRESRPGSSQLEIKEIGSDDSTYKPFDGANFKVGTEFQLDRLSDRQMEIAYDKMTPAEKEAIVEAIQDQDNSTAGQEVTAQDITSVKPESTNEEEEETEGFNLRNRRRNRRASESRPVNSDEAINSIDPTKGTQADIEKQKKNCGGHK